MASLAQQHIVSPMRCRPGRRTSRPASLAQGDQLAGELVVVWLATGLLLDHLAQTLDADRFAVDTPARHQLIPSRLQSWLALFGVAQKLGAQARERVAFRVGSP